VDQDASSVEREFDFLAAEGVIARPD